MEAFFCPGSVGGTAGGAATVRQSGFSASDEVPEPVCLDSPPEPFDGVAVGRIAGQELRPEAVE